MDSARASNKRKDIADAMRATIPIVDDFSRSQKASIRATAADRELLIRFAADIAALLDENEEMTARLGLSISAQHSGDDTFAPGLEHAGSLKLSNEACRQKACPGCCFLHLSAKGAGFSEFVEITLDDNGAFSTLSSVKRLEDTFRSAPIVKISRRDDRVVFEHKAVANPYSSAPPPPETMTMSAEDLLLEFVNKLRANLKKRARQYSLARS